MLIMETITLEKHALVAANEDGFLFLLEGKEPIFVALCENVGMFTFGAGNSINQAWERAFEAMFTKERT